MLEEKIKLSDHSSYKIGGPARYFFRAKKAEEIIKNIDKWRKIADGVFILGGGTNILFSDNGFNGLVLKPDFNNIKKINEFSLSVGAGVLMDDLINHFLDKGFAGLEWAGGLPGTLGGAIRGNAGAFGGEIKNIVKEVVSIDISSTPKIIRRKNKECGFSYRNSVFSSGGKEQVINPGEIIIEAILDLKKGDKKLIRDIIQKNIYYRKEHQPLEYPNIGSTFKNVDIKKAPKNRIKEFKFVIKTDPFPVIPAAYLISEAGLNGVSCGGAMISPKHPNFIVNVMHASASDVRNLIELAKSEVKNKFGIDLEEEIIIF